MNKKGEEESSGIGTVIQTLLIVIGLVVLVAVMYTNVWPKVKGSFTNIVGEKGDVNKIYEDVFKQDEIKQREEEIAANEIISLLIKNFDSVKDKGRCMKELDFNILKDKDFEIEFSKSSGGSKIKVVRGDRNNQLRIYTAESRIPICFFNNLEQPISFSYLNFWLVSGMNKVYDGQNEIDLTLANIVDKPILYKLENQICFVGRDSLWSFKPDAIENCDKIK